MSLHTIRARGDFLKRGAYIDNKKLLLNLSVIKTLFFRNERILRETFLKKTISILSIDFLYLVDPLANKATGLTLRPLSKSISRKLH